MTLQGAGNILVSVDICARMCGWGDGKKGGKKGGGEGGRNGLIPAAELAKNISPKQQQIKNLQQHAN